MESIENILLDVISEQNSNLPILKTTGNRPIVDAIKNRKKITFYYSGPRKPKKDSVKAGYRVKVEPVALGLSQKGKLMIRAWVDVPSTTKTGFGKGHWRTFLLSRTNNVQVTDEIFNEKRPGYNDEGDGKMSVVYTKTDWTKQPEVKKSKITKPTEPTKPEPKPQELPQPKPEVKPEPVKATTEPPKEEPKPETTSQELPQPNPEVKPTEIPKSDKEKELYNAKKNEWINNQKKIGGNINPGQGTRERFKKEVEKELNQPKPEDEKDNQLQESLKRIKSLMLL